MKVIYKYISILLIRTGISQGCVLGPDLLTQSALQFIQQTWMFGGQNMFLS